MTINARAFNPVAIDSKGNVTYLKPNSQYSMDRYWRAILIPAGSGQMNSAPPGGPAINNFTVTFEKAGTYSYVCNIHPWMTGLVTVN